MRRLMTLMLAFAVLLGMATLVSVEGKHLGKKNKGKVYRVLGDRDFSRSSRRRAIRNRRSYRVLGLRYKNYGQQRSALAHRQNAERRALKRLHQRERRGTRRNWYR